MLYDPRRVYVTKAPAAKSNKEFDLIVIGSGPAGIHSAMQASKLGKKVCIIEATPDKIGGAMIHTGTLPSKTLRETLATIHNIKEHAGKEWVTRIIDNLNTGKLFERARKVSQQEELLVKNYLSKNNIAIKKGWGKIIDANTIEVAPEEDHPYQLTTENILIATGSRPRHPDDVPFDGWRVIDADDALNLEQVPRSMMIYGAGVIGCEYACIFAAMGVDLTLIDGREIIMPYMDQEIVDELKKSMESLGVKFLLGKDYSDLKTVGPKVHGKLNEDKFETDCFFHCAGRVPQVTKIGLDKVPKIEQSKRGHLVVNENYQTTVPNIYAAGDVIGPPGLAATSAEQGRQAAIHALGNKKNSMHFPEVYPYGVYTIPELSMAGKTEEQLIEEKVDYVVGRAYYRELARGFIRGDSFGKMKILVDKNTHKILGIHIAGADACNLIHTGLAFMIKGGVAQDLINMIFNYPTLAESYRIAGFNALNKIFPDGIIASAPDTDCYRNT